LFAGGGGFLTGTNPACSGRGGDGPSPCGSGRLRRELIELEEIERVQF
jgi:hypothetical protein